MIKKLVRFTLIIVTGLLCFVFLSDTPQSIQVANLGPFQLAKQLSEIPNLDLDRLRSAKYVQFPQYCIQDVAVNKNGDIYVAAGLGPSNFYQVSHQNTSIYNKISETPGRVLGTALNKQENLLAFSDQSVGLRILNLKTYQIQTVATEFENRKFVSINSIAFGRESHILYFTHSTEYFGMPVYHLQLLYKTGSGRVYQLNLKTKKITKLLDGIQFANGIVYSEKQNCLFVNQLNLYRVIRIPLEGADSPKYSVVVDNLVGYPDNLKITEDGKLWVAFASLRDPVNVFIDNNPIVRKALINIRLPEELFKKFANVKYSGGVKVDPQTGQIVDYFFGKPNRIAFITGILERNNKIYMSSLKNNLIAIADYW